MRTRGLAKPGIWNFLLPLVGLLLLSVPVTADRGDPEIEIQGRSVDELVAGFMREHQIAGMSLAIVQAPYITRVSGYGVGDPDTRLLVGSETMFGLGEMSRAYTAVAVLQLVEQGKLALDDPLERHLDILPRSWRGITVRRVLQARSGIPEITDRVLQGAKSEAELLSALAQEKLLFPPGTQVSKSATDHLLLMLLVEKASGERYEDFVRQGQLQPLGLKRTIFASEIPSLPREALAPGESHRAFLNDPALINPAEPATPNRSAHHSQLLPDRGAIYASAYDVSVWDIGLAGEILIKDPALRAMLYQPLSADLPTSGTWDFPGRPGLMVIQGRSGGFSALLSRFTHSEDLLCVTLLANKEGLDLSQLARSIAGAYDSRLGPPGNTGGMRVQQSPYSVDETTKRLENELQARGVQVMARIDHAGAAKEVGLELAPTRALIFGNPAVGTLLMQANRASAVDLPLTAVVWEEQGEVWIAATDPVELAERHDLPREVAHKMRAAVDQILGRAISPVSRW